MSGGVAAELPTSADRPALDARGMGTLGCRLLSLVLVLSALLALGGCIPLGASVNSQASYAALSDGGRLIAAVPRSKVPSRFFRREVAYAGDEAPGTVLVDLPSRYLFLVLPSRRAVRYGIGVGRAAYRWQGRASVGRKAAWPRWTPTPDMLDRTPEAARYEAGVEPGVFNPLGARALYLYQDGRDTLFRIHGTAEWWSIGEAATSGCIRLLNQDIIDLYSRVPVGAAVIVRAK